MRCPVREPLFRIFPGVPDISGYAACSAYQISEETVTASIEGREILILPLSFHNPVGQMQGRKYRIACVAEDTKMRIRG
jgi:hypothetical protein